MGTNLLHWIKNALLSCFYITNYVIFLGFAISTCVLHVCLKDPFYYHFI